MSKRAFALRTTVIKRAFALRTTVIKRASYLSTSGLERASYLSTSGLERAITLATTVIKRAITLATTVIKRLVISQPVIYRASYLSTSDIPGCTVPYYTTLYCTLLHHPVHSSTLPSLGTLSSRYLAGRTSCMHAVATDTALRRAITY